jgi:putative membrane protein
MRKNFLALALPLLLIACNNETKDSVEKADSANQAKEERADSTGKPIIHTDTESTDFLVKAADGGMAEVNLGELAQQKASHDMVKSFGTMMVNDHTAANNQVKTLATQRNVTLPVTLGEANQKLMDDLMKKTGADFDRSYMKAMVDDHEAYIREFEKASGTVKDVEVKNFIDNTLPILRRHLDSAKAIRKVLK